MSSIDPGLIEEIRDSARDFLQRRDQRQRKRSAAPPDRDYWREIAEVGWLGMSAVSYTHLTLPTKRIV